MLSDTNGSRQRLRHRAYRATLSSVFDRNVESASDDFGKLTLVQSFKDGVDGVDGLNGARAVAVSPDGKNVYVAAEDDDAVAVFAREATGGTLVFVEAAFDGENGVDGIDQAYGIAISTNSRETYIAGFGDDAIALFRRASGSRCTGAGVGTLLDTGVEIAAGGQVVYTVNATIDPGATGYLINEAYVTVPGAIQEPGPDSNGLHPAGVCTDNVPPVLVPPLPPLTTIVGNNGCRDIDTLTPRTELAIDKTDGDDVAVPGTEITYTITVRNHGPSNVVGAAGAGRPDQHLPDRRDLDLRRGALGHPDLPGRLRRRRDAARTADRQRARRSEVGGGQPGRRACLRHRPRRRLARGVQPRRRRRDARLSWRPTSTASAGVDGLNGATDVLVSPDGKNVYVAGQVDDAVAVFTRQDNPLLPATFGTLTFLELQQSPAVAGLDEPVALAMDAAGDTLYVAAANSNAITVFDRNTGDRRPDLPRDPRGRRRQRRRARRRQLGRGQLRRRMGLRHGRERRRSRGLRSRSGDRRARPSRRARSTASAAWTASPCRAASWSRRTT